MILRMIRVLCYPKKNIYIYIYTHSMVSPTAAGPFVNTLSLDGVLGELNNYKLNFKHFHLNVNFDVIANLTLNPTWNVNSYVS